jgi:hypothetical protein
MAENEQQARSYQVGDTLAELPKELPRSREVTVVLGDDTAGVVRPEDNS